MDPCESVYRMNIPRLGVAIRRPVCRLYTNVYNTIFEPLFKILHRAVKQKLLSLFFFNNRLIQFTKERGENRGRERESNSSCGLKKKKEKYWNEFEKGDFQPYIESLANYLNRNSLIRDSRSFEGEKKKVLFRINTFKRTALLDRHCRLTGRNSIVITVRPTNSR